MNKSTRMLILLFISAVFFLVELSVGCAVHSLALIADSFHMLNDVLALAIAAWTLRLTKQEDSVNSRFTYGWHRAETLGALINGIFLAAFALAILLGAIQRFIEIEAVSNPFLVLIVGCCGLVSNIFGLFLFHDHGHSRGEVCDEKTLAETDASTKSPGELVHHGATLPLQLRTQPANLDIETGMSTAVIKEVARLTPDSPSTSCVTEHNPRITIPHQHRPHPDLNIQCLILHLIGDALGNLGIILSAVFIWQTHFSWRYYADPLISLVIAAIIACSAVPLCKAASKILLQAAPANVDVAALRKDIEDIPGVIDLHDLHVWQLSRTESVASVHIKIGIGLGHDVEDKETVSMAQYTRLANCVRMSLGARGVRSCTIQPEFVRLSTPETKRHIEPASTETLQGTSSVDVAQSHISLSVGHSDEP